MTDPFAEMRRSFLNEYGTAKLRGPDRVFMGRLMQTAFREGFQAGAPDDTWDQEWEDGEWKVSKSREVSE